MNSGLEVTAVEMARSSGIDPKKFRKALRDEKFPWHRHNERWTVQRDSSEYHDMQKVLNRLLYSV